METSRLAVAAGCLSADLRTALRRARDLGIRGVELDARAGLAPEQVTKTGLRQIRKWLGDEGVEVAAIAFRTRGGYADPERLEARITATKAALALAHDLGAGVVLNRIGAIPPADSAEWRLLVEVLTDIGGFGHKVGATLAVEAGAAAPADLARLVAVLPEASLACDVVTGALIVHGHDPAEAVAVLGDHLGSVHATDAVAGPFAGRGRAVVLGTGDVDFAAFFAALEERGYRGWVGLEPVEDRTAREELAAAIESLRAL